LGFLISVGYTKNEKKLKKATRWAKQSNCKAQALHTYKYLVLN